MNAGTRPTIAGIDIGTNSVLLTIAEVAKGGELIVIDQRATVTRLGQDVDRSKRLHPDAQERTLTCLAEYRSVMERAGVSYARAVGTSALRDAAGGQDFLARAVEALGADIEVISGLREAELTFFGALSGIDNSGAQEASAPTFVFDIGGGSTELIVGNFRAASPGADSSLVVEQCTSLDMGSVRLTERNRPSNPPTHEQLTNIRSQVRDALEQSSIVVPAGARVVGVAGTVTTLFAISQGMEKYEAAAVHGALMGQSEVETWARRLGEMTLEERLGLAGLTRGRADVIVAGALLCAQILEFAGASTLTVSDRGVRFGLLQELARSSP
jgi:exopolyphosphatase/guanosine-5'-triphosphate,3'-diphosphate pyrophosphatase